MFNLAAERDVFYAAEGELYERHGFHLPEAPLEAFASPHRHLLANDGERSFAALVSGRVVGFTAAFARGETWFLSALFVDPEFQGRGIGRRLLDRSWGGEYRRRTTITDTDDPLLDAAAQLPVERLRSLDAIHLAAAQLLGRDLSVLVSYDERMIAAAAELGIPVTSPR